MAISPPGDIVMDVLRASDPRKIQAATQKLTRMAATPDAGEARMVATPTAAKPVRQTFNAEAARVAFQNQQTVQATRADAQAAVRPLSAGQQFEAMVLQGFVNKMLPENTAHTFGQGTAGSVWKSYMSEALATQVARSNPIGIGDMVVNRVSEVPQVQPPTTPMATASTAPAEPDANQAANQVSLVTFLSKLQELFLELFAGNDDPNRVAGMNTLAKWRDDF